MRYFLKYNPTTKDCCTYSIGDDNFEPANIAQEGYIVVAIQDNSLYSINVNGEPVKQGLPAYRPPNTGGKAL